MSAASTVAVEPGDDTSGNGPGQATRARIMTVAERLFAQRGIDGVSIRDITTEAEVNTAAIHYHFGSKTALVEAILTRRAAELGRRRADFLERVEAAEQPTLREVVEAFVVPTAEMADRETGAQHYIGFLTSVLAHPELMARVVDTYEVHSARFVDALERVTPHLSSDVRELRFALAKDMVNRVLGQPDGPVRCWLEQRAPGAGDNLSERLVDFFVGAFAAPATD
jgi:AcrR family transcriptional regulator